MKPVAFELFRPRSLEDALGLLGEYGDEAVLLAGGQSLVPMMNMRLVQPAVVVDLNEVVELAFVEAGADGVRVGAMTRHRAVELSPSARERCPVLRDALAHVGFRPIRERGTIGGSIAHADPTAELVAVATGLEALVRLRSVRGERTLPACEFLSGVLTNARQPDELVTEVVFPARSAGAVHAFTEFEASIGDFPLVTVLLLARVSGDGVSSVRLVVGGAGGMPHRLEACEELIATSGLHPQIAPAVGDLARSVVQPRDHDGMSASYRKALVGTLVERTMDDLLRKVGAST